MYKKQKMPAIVRFAILTTVTVIAWFSFEVYRALTLKPPPFVSEEVSSPVNPALDATVLDKIQNRIHLNDSEIGDTVLSPNFIVTPEPTEAPVEQVETELEVTESTESANT